MKLSELKEGFVGCRKWLKLPEGINAVVTNGRVLTAQSHGSNPSERVSLEDFALLDRHASTRQLGAQVDLSIPN